MLIFVPIYFSGITNHFKRMRDHNCSLTLATHIRRRDCIKCVGLKKHHRLTWSKRIEMINDKTETLYIYIFFIVVIIDV